MAQSADRTTSIPKEHEVKIHFTAGGYTIIPKLNRDNFVRLNASNISYIKDGGEESKVTQLNVDEPTVEAPLVTADPSMQWSKKKLLKFAKKEKGVEYDDEKSVTKTEILSDILTK